MTPRPGKVEVPIAGEVISRRPKGAASRAHHKAISKDDGEGVTRDPQKVVRLDGPAKINWLCKALPLLRRRAMTAAQFLDIVCNNRFAANVDDVMPWGTQMISMLRQELDDLQPQQVHQLQQSDLWSRFADSDDERALVTATSSAAPGRAAAFKAAASAFAKKGDGQRKRKSSSGDEPRRERAPSSSSAAKKARGKARKKRSSSSSSSSSSSTKRSKDKGKATGKAKKRSSSSSSSSSSSAKRRKEKKAGDGAAEAWDRMEAGIGM
ncbi:unnamed protein product [Effrenium voratum]|nr:unnamed protein product [Effrenium voratum]